MIEASYIIKSLLGLWFQRVRIMDIMAVNTVAVWQHGAGIVAEGLHLIYNNDAKI